MKSVERHKLETNWLASHLNRWIEQLQPHSSTIAGVAIAIVVLAFGWWFFAGASATRDAEAWTAFNNVVGTSMDEQALSQLAKSAAEFENTDMYPWSRVTWADGQVWVASRTILQNRASATKGLDDAATVYQTVISSSPDAQLVDRARFGLARVYEMRNEVDKARDEYGKVKGAFATLAKRRIEALEEQKTKETLSWLAKAEAQRPVSPTGPGTPGQRPPLDLEDLKLPGVSGSSDPNKGPLNIDDLLKDIGNLGKDAGSSTERYPMGDPTKTGGEGATGEYKGAKSDEKPAETSKDAGEAPKETTEKAK